MGCSVAGPKAWWAARSTWAGVAQAGGKRGEEGRWTGPEGWAGLPRERKEEGQVRGEGKGGWAAGWARQAQFGREYTERVL